MNSSKDFLLEFNKINPNSEPSSEIIGNAIRVIKKCQMCFMTNISYYSTVCLPISGTEMSSIINKFIVVEDSIQMHPKIGSDCIKMLESTKDDSIYLNLLI